MPPRIDLPGRRELLALAAVLAATTLTAAAAIAGLTRHPSAPVQVVPTVVQQQAPALPRVEPEQGG